MSDKFNIIPIVLAGFLHVAIFAGMIFAYDWSRPVLPAVPLAIKGTLVSEDSLQQPPPVVAEVAEPERESEPELLPEPDNSEQLRVEAEEKKRLDDLRVERERIAREDKAERQRKQKEEQERKRRAEAETERRRQEVERKRIEDIERQRVENERLRKQAEDAERQRQLEQDLQAEQNRIDQMNAGALAAYQFALRQAIERNWIRPASAVQGLSCEVRVRQSLGGDVLNVVIESCNGDDAVRRSIESAVLKASPLPLPQDLNLLERNLRFIFEPTE
jgi:colicin import membrane protein